MTAERIEDTRYDYDGLGRLAKVSVVERNNVPLSVAEQTRYRYDLLGNLNSQTQPNGIVTEYVYDSLNRLDLMTHSKPDDTLLAEFDYTVRADGKTEERDWTPSGSNLTPYQQQFDLGVRRNGPADRGDIR